MQTRLFALPTEDRARPAAQPFRYPTHNRDYGVEQDFHAFLRGSDVLTSDPDEADWHYLPVYWTRWHLNHEYAQTGVDELQALVDAVLIDDAKTFTVCQYDDGPVVDLHRATQFLASRKGDVGIDVPLLCDPHRRPVFAQRKKHRASFMGRVHTHPVRAAMATALSDVRSVAIVDGDKGPRAYVKSMLRSRIALCPRGYGGSSFRFFEAMEMGVVPMLISDVDTRPFQRFIDWDRVSLYCPGSAGSIRETVESRSDEELDAMGRAAQRIYRDELAYGRWCKYVLRELACRRASGPAR